MSGMSNKVALITGASSGGRFEARAIVFLCSDEASYITGTTLTPDGGLTLTV